MSHERLCCDLILKDFSTCNASFDSAVMRIVYPGVNQNKTSISREVLERCAHTIYNVPIVAHYIRDDDSIGGHDLEVVRKDGRPTVVSVTQPVGVIPESACCWWETVEESDGTEHEYFCTEALLWKRQEAYQHLKDIGSIALSMEIDIKSGHKEGAIYSVDDFEFNAICLLESQQPCFESASLSLYRDNTDILEQCRAMFAALPEAMSTYQLGVSNRIMNEKLKVMESYGLKLDQLDFELADFDLKELHSKFAALKAKFDAGGGDDVSDGGDDGDHGDDADHSGDGGDDGGDDGGGGSSGGPDGGGPGSGTGSETGGGGSGGSGGSDGDHGGETGGGGDGDPDPDPHPDPEPDPEPEPKPEPESDPNDDDDDGGSGDAGGVSVPNANHARLQFSLLSGDYVNELQRAVSAGRGPDDCWRYWLVDYDADERFVYCEDHRFGKYQTVRMSYKFDGDRIVIDFDSAVRVKRTFTEFDGGSDTGDLTGTAMDQYAEHYAKKYSDELAVAEKELADLRDFRKRVESEQRKDAEVALFARFTDLESVPEFTSLKDNSATFSLEDLEEKCFALRGRFGTYSVQSPSKPPKLPVKHDKESDEPYGGLIERYLRTHK